MDESIQECPWRQDDGFSMESGAIHCFDASNGVVLSQDFGHDGLEESQIWGFFQPLLHG